MSKYEIEKKINFKKNLKKIHRNSTVNPHKECVCLSLVARVNHFYFLKLYLYLLKD
jgi:hypothetical protein